MSILNIVSLVVILVNILIASYEQNMHSVGGWLTALLFLFAVIFEESKNDKNKSRP